MDGGWSNWTDWRACVAFDQFCGAGYQLRNRSCDSPAPQYGGATCVGQVLENSTCNVTCGVQRRLCAM